MSKREIRGETHGCIVCGKPYQLYVVYEDGNFVDFKPMSAGAKPVRHAHRPIVACETHDEDQIKAALQKVYGTQEEDDQAGLV